MPESFRQPLKAQVAAHLPAGVPSEPRGEDHGSGSPAGDGPLRPEKRTRELVGGAGAVRQPTLSNADFQRLSQFITQRWGINLPPNKKLLLEGRLRKRLGLLGLRTFAEYCDYLFSPVGQAQEPPLMIDLVTTNKTDFFREADHFTYLVEQAIPTLFPEDAGSGCLPVLKVWSAACATGEEPYTLAMLLREVALTRPGFQFAILATDISARALEIGRTGIYSDERSAEIPLSMRRKYLLRSKDHLRRQVRFMPEIRSAIRFHRLNLMEIGQRVVEQFQVIFCRNVLIYFDRFTQERVLQDLHQRLVPGGYLFLGHAEALTSLHVPFYPVAPTVYRRPLTGPAAGPKVHSA